MNLKSGWLDRQFDRVDNDIEKWPDWMKREAAFDTSASEQVSEDPEPRLLTRMAASDHND